MRLLFFDGVTSCYQDTNGKLYTAGNMVGSIMERYSAFCDKLVLLLLESSKIYTPAEAMANFTPVDTERVEIVVVPNIRGSLRNFLNLKSRKKGAEIIDREIQKVDRVIVRAPGRFYSNTALKCCRKYHKLYLIESVDFPFECTYYTRIWMFAPYCEFTAKREIAKAPYVLYVTEKALQDRYPTSGKSLGCSDVNLSMPDESVLQNRLLRINTYQGGGH